ncbi:uncharacterized protein LOC124360253 [Homalodisca vitripennis]|uniref:uncharacterized protein LOC124360253 n=1 Tax=Homalodisca vitripennis TaxID=197043 RepID=UPI001EECED7A|nr:uncharacterized protein LOC124360253 [Homalodisca vitripennis]
MICVATIPLFGLLLSSCFADFNVSEYIYWKKADISAWDQYFPSRALQTELLTNQAAVAAVNSLFSSLNSSLEKVVVFQAQELRTAQLLMNGTEAQGCVNGIASFMPDAISQEVLTYNDCSADALPSLLRMYYAWAKQRKSYKAAYQRALTGIDVCAKTYPNSDAVDRLKACVEALSTDYFQTANATIQSLDPSPAMSYFKQVVVECASLSCGVVVEKGSLFLKMLLECSALDPNIDPTLYAQELDSWKGYNDTLASQILEAQTTDRNKVRDLEAEMISYYQLQRSALEKYVVESRGFDFYLDKVHGYLSGYYSTLVETAADNPGDPDCVADASVALDVIANISAYNSLTCDIAIVSNTTNLISAVNNDFSYLNAQLPIIGNAAIIKCFLQGYIFAPNTIIDCFNLLFTDFDLKYDDYQADIVKDVAVLESYETSFFNGSDFPCGSSSLKRTFLAADNVLYHLQRCLYITSGTTYDVTTPSSITTAETTTQNTYPKTSTSRITTAETTPVVTTPAVETTPVVTTPEAGTTPPVTTPAAGTTPPVTTPAAGTTPPITTPAAGTTPPASTPAAGTTPPASTPAAGSTPPASTPANGTTPAATTPAAGSSPGVTTLPPAINKRGRRLTQ